MRKVRRVGWGSYGGEGENEYINVQLSVVYILGYNIYYIRRQS